MAQVEVRSCPLWASGGDFCLHLYQQVALPSVAPYAQRIGSFRERLPDQLPALCPPPSLALQLVRQQCEQLGREREQRAAARVSELERDKATVEARAHSLEQAAADAARAHRQASTCRARAAAGCPGLCSRGPPSPRAQGGGS